MNRTEKRLLRRTVQLGLLLTAVVIAMDRLGLLSPFERFLYDTRAQYCQFFTPQPTDKIVHLDIDDETLQAIGWWPWPRTNLAMLLDEIRLAGPKIVGFDVLFPESQPPRLERAADGNLTTFEDDRAFAAAIRRAGNVLIPLSVDPRQAVDSPVLAAMVELLTTDLEMDKSQLHAKLSQTGPNRRDLPAQINAHFLEARKRAMFDRVVQAIASGQSDPDTLRQSLTPRAWASDERTDAVLLLGNILPRALSVRRLQEFTQPIPPGLPPLLTSETEVATIAPLSEAARYCGFVDFIQERDGVVRSVPLFVNYRGRMLPHMLLVTTCALLDVNVADLKITADSVTIPARDGPVVIPVTTLNSDKFGRLGMFASIPWFGRTDKWEFMYDYPNHAESKQHLPLRTVWTICQFQQSIHENTLKVIEAIAGIISVMEGDKSKADEFLRTASSLPPDVLEQKVREMVNDADVKDYAKIYRETSADQRGEDGEKFLASFAVLESVPEQNARLEQLRAAARRQLRRQLEGRIVLIGWSAVGRIDAYTTSLHPLCPGVAVQGVMINGILTNHLWRRAPWWVTLLCTAVIGGATTAIVALWSTKRALLLTLLLVAGYAALNGIVFFDWGNGIVGAAGPITAAAVLWFGLTLARFIWEQIERSRITKRFSSYVDPALVREYVDDPDAAGFAGREREITVVFTDLAGFTTLSEKLRAGTVQLLNEYMSLMLPIIRENRGYWNKFLGDGIMFFFNAPRDNAHHARDAVYTVLQMQKAMGPFNQRLFERRLPHVAMRAGISTGMMIVGDAGSTDPSHLASDYTVLGDDVNLGARLESANKALGSRVLMNGRTAELLAGEFLLRPMGRLQVVGKTEGVDTFEALCLARDATDKQRSLVQMTTQVVDRFRSAEFQSCIDAACELEDAHGSSKFTQLYKHLSKQYLIERPDDFDGQIVLVEK